MLNKLCTFVCILAVIFTLAGCGDEQTAETKDLLVKTQVVNADTSQASSTYAGVVRGRYETNMAFQVGGRIVSRNVQLGDHVSAGQVLMVIDPRDVIQQANQGDAQVAAAKAQLDLAQTNLKRYRELYAQEAIPASTLDQFQTTYEAALASYEAALSQAAQGHNALGYTNLVTAANGVISSITAEAGQVVGAGQTVMTITQTNELEVEINIPENHVNDVTIGKAVQVKLWANKKDAVNGFVREISPMADNTARTFKARITLQNPPDGIQLGMTASVICPNTSNTASSENAAQLPLSAVYQTGDTPQVWLVDKDDMTLKLKKVQIEPAQDNTVKVTGLENGDIVVTAGVHKLREGTKVRLMDGESK